MAGGEGGNPLIRNHPSPYPLPQGARVYENKLRRCLMRRELRFKNFEEVRAELARLEQGPVETTGVWSYAQILDHCAASLENSMKGLEREMSWWKRNIAGPFA